MFNERGLEDLANAVVLQACKDYKDAFFGNAIDRLNSESAMIDCEKFFLGGDLMQYTQLDGKMLMYRVRIEAINEIIEDYKCVLEQSGSVILQVRANKKENVKGCKHFVKPNLINDFYDLLREQIHKLEIVRDKLLKEYKEGCDDE